MASVRHPGTRAAIASVPVVDIVRIVDADVSTPLFALVFSVRIVEKDRRLSPPPEPRDARRIPVSASKLKTTIAVGRFLELRCRFDWPRGAGNIRTTERFFPISNRSNRVVTDGQCRTGKPPIVKIAPTERRSPLIVSSIRNAHSFFLELFSYGLNKIQVFSQHFSVFSVYLVRTLDTCTYVYLLVRLRKSESFLVTRQYFFENIVSPSFNKITQLSILKSNTRSPRTAPHTKVQIVVLL